MVTLFQKTEGVQHKQQQQTASKLKLTSSSNISAFYPELQMQISVEPRTDLRSANFRSELCLFFWGFRSKLWGYQAPANRFCGEF